MGLLFFLSDVIQPIHSSCKYGLVPNHYHLNISMLNLHTVLYTFPNNDNNYVCIAQTSIWTYSVALHNIVKVKLC